MILDCRSSSRVAYLRVRGEVEPLGLRKGKKVASDGYEIDSLCQRFIAGRLSDLGGVDPIANRKRQYKPDHPHA